MIDKLSADVVQSGKEHPFVIALLKELRARRENLQLAAESASHPSPAHTLGKLSALRDVITTIENAKGRDE